MGKYKAAAKSAAKKPAGAKGEERHSKNERAAESGAKRGRRQIVVLGMHRSGTSAVTGALHMSGAYVGEEESLTGRSWENRLGFFERREARSICDSLLQLSGADWWNVSSFDPDMVAHAVIKKNSPHIRKLISELDDHGTWVIKEPRLCLLLPIFNMFLHDPVVVHIFRHPVEVARSLRRRNGFPLRVGLAMWEVYNVAALRNACGMKRILLNYQHLVMAPQETFEDLARQLCNLGVNALDPTKAATFIDQCLQREHATKHDLSLHLTDAQTSLWERLCRGDIDAAFDEVSPGATLTLREFEADHRSHIEAEFKARELTGRLDAEQKRAGELSAKLEMREAEARELTSRLDAEQERARELTGRLDAEQERAGDLSAKLEVREAEFRELTGRLEAEQERAGELSAKLEVREAEFRELEMRLRSAKEKHEFVTRSLSWRMTWPLRKANLALQWRARTKRKLRRGADLIASSGLFDIDFYLGQNEDVDKAKIDPVLHYLCYGAAEGRNPGPEFDTKFYLNQNPDVVEAGINPLVHFVKFGRSEGRERCAPSETDNSSACASPRYLDPRHYECEQTTAASTGADASNEHVYQFELKSLAAEREQGSCVDEGNPIFNEMDRSKEDDIMAIRASALFDGEWYLQTYPDVKLLGMDPAVHYLTYGATLNRNPSANFNGADYLRINSDVASAGVNPLLHYIRWGKIEARLGDARIDGYSAPELHSSTFNENSQYSFLSSDSLDSIGEKYLRSRVLKGDTKQRVAIFSGITTAYDSIQCHEHLLDFADYFIFTDSNSMGGYVYAYREMPYFDEDPVRCARFVKTHPHMLLSQYEIAIWIDGNILIRDDLSGMIDSFRRSGLPLAAVPHPLRCSVYEEAQECIKRGKDDPARIEAQIARYRAEGFDCDDLIESNFLMYRLNHPRLIPFLNSWWAELERGSRRDQISINYALHKANATWFPLTTKPNSVRNHPALALFHHGSNPCPYVPKADTSVEPKLTYGDVLDKRIAQQMAKSVAVVVCVHNALDVVKLCLESVVANRNVDRHQVIIVDDGSDVVTRTWLRDFGARHDNLYLIWHEHAQGYTKAANVGLRAAASDLAILLNSDTVVAGRWIDKLLDAAFSNSGVGIVGPLSSAASHQSIPDHRSTANQTAVNDLPAGYSVADMNAWCEQHSTADFLPRVPLIHGFCMALTREVIETVGYFDEVNFPFGFGEENDYCLRAVDAGFSLAVATHTYVYHKKSQSYEHDRRIALVTAGNMKVRDLHGKERVLRAVRSMEANPHLARMRRLAEGLFVHHLLLQGVESLSKPPLDSATTTSSASAAVPTDRFSSPTTSWSASGASASTRPTSPT